MSATRFTHYNSDEPDDALFIAALQALLAGDSLALRDDYGLISDISDELLVQASQEFEFKFEQEQLQSLSDIASRSLLLQCAIQATSLTTTASDTLFSSPCSSSQIDQVEESWIPTLTLLSHGKNGQCITRSI